MPHSLNILLVDDEEVVHQTLNGYLKDLGHVVEGVRDGLLALNLIQEKDFDLALVDIRMPGLDGMTLLEKIPEVRPDLPIVIITATALWRTCSSVSLKAGISRGTASLALGPISNKRL